MSITVNNAILTVDEAGELIEILDSAMQDCGEASLEELDLANSIRNKLVAVRDGRNLAEELIEVAKALPVEHFINPVTDELRGDIDASEYVDHCADFAVAMRRANALGDCIGL